MESLKELSRICQKPNYKTVGNWMVRHILRDAALPMTWLLLHTPVTANQVTLVALIIGLAGNAMLSGGSTGLFLSGVICLQLWYYLDHVDGQIARYRKTSSLTGRFLDFLMHHLVHACIYFPWGWHIWQVEANSAFLVAGFMLSVLTFTFNMLPDIGYKAMFEKIVMSPQCEWRKCSMKEKKNYLPNKSFARKVFSFLHKSVEMHVLMNLLTVAALVEWFIFRDLSFRHFLFYYYLFTVPLITLVKITHIIIKKRIDADFEALLQ